MPQGRKSLDQDLKLAITKQVQETSWTDLNPDIYVCKQEYLSRNH